MLMLYHYSYNLVLCDRLGRGIVYCVGRPRDEKYMVEVNEEVMRVIEKGRRNAKFTTKQLANRRGPFPAEAIGYSHGGGQVCSSFNFTPPIPKAIS